MADAMANLYVASFESREDTPSPDEVGLAAMEGVQGFEGLGPDFGWEYFFPDTNFGPWTPGQPM
ncbi:hypothetical protein N7467_005134 [Penicillium canescens]|nr:hypothetical protein N7467_005134 [Penicillium canescens]